MTQFRTYDDLHTLEGAHNTVQASARELRILAALADDPADFLDLAGYLYGYTTTEQIRQALEA